MTQESPSPDDMRYEKTYGIEKRTAHELTLDGPGYNGPVSAQIRTEGALVRSLTIGDTPVLVSPDTRDPDSGDDFFQPVKTDATITMLPAGPGEGPQHGASRYTQYEIEHSAGTKIELMAKDRLLDVGHVKTLEVEPDGLAITDDVVNTGPHETGLSIGEHFYFACSERDLEAVRFLGSDGIEQRITGRTVRGSDLTGTVADFMPELEGGNAVYIEAFSGSQIIDIPGIGEVSLQAQATAEGENVPVGLLMWHRPGQDSICFEPVAGLSLDPDGTLHNDGIKLKAGQSAKLDARVRLGG